MCFFINIDKKLNRKNKYTIKINRKINGKV